MPETAVKPEADERHCPICARTLPERWLRKPVRRISINELVVCKKCRNGFANRRQLAYIIDSTVFGIVVFSLTALFMVVGDVIYSKPNLRDGFDAIVVVVLALFAISPLMFCCKDGFGGWSPGKVLCGVQVIDWETREPIGFGRSLKRNLCLLIPSAVYTLGAWLGFPFRMAAVIVGLVIVLVLSSTLMKGWRWGDKWARTRVIWRKHQFKPPFDPRGILCLSCGYDLTGNESGRCPECGTPIRRDGQPLNIGLPADGPLTT